MISYRQTHPLGRVRTDPHDGHLTVLTLGEPVNKPAVRRIVNVLGSIGLLAGLWVAAGAPVTSMI